jgi:hypothetical protein
MEMRHLGNIMILDGSIYQNLVYYLQHVDFANKKDVLLTKNVFSLLYNDYDFVFWLPNIIPYKKEKKRIQSYWQAVKMGFKIKKMLNLFNINYSIIWQVTRRGRVDKICKYLFEAK